MHLRFSHMTLKDIFIRLITVGFVSLTKLVTFTLKTVNFLFQFFQLLKDILLVIGLRANFDADQIAHQVIMDHLLLLDNLKFICGQLNSLEFMLLSFELFNLLLQTLYFSHEILHITWFLSLFVFFVFFIWVLLWRTSTGFALSITYFTVCLFMLSDSTWMLLLLNFYPSELPDPQILSFCWSLVFFSWVLIAFLWAIFWKFIELIMSFVFCMNINEARIRIDKHFDLIVVFYMLILL